MNSNLGILFLLMLFTGLPLHFLLALPFALATPVPAPPVPLDWPDQKPTHTHKPLLPPPPPRNLEDHRFPPLDCGGATHKHGFAAGCVRRERDVYMVEGKRDETVVRVPEGGLGRPTVGGRLDLSVDPNRHPTSQLLKEESKKNK
ncbi:hypothetical protein EPUS_08118 [Endocarpon pusillum Z07020]|uniref:Uncharacterized protein n=1 Tax=Endocarpon pusillum (strain Z07020 / HMAS-L-300199) TaxID=1263415 RepID=U1HTX3_ENDPU|nr:uncharacterized protein EPUS_08118 [Endocarpon pusillum Z07020]ERF74070.1 hypothetical protein EPUS_08118 [Endocarpon pusillum Z07020]